MRNDAGRRPAKPIATALNLLTELLDKEPSKPCADCFPRGGPIPYAHRRPPDNQPHSRLNAIGRNAAYS